MTDLKKLAEEIANKIVEDNFLRQGNPVTTVLEALEHVQKESLAAESQVLKTLRRQNTHLLEELKLVSFHLPRDRTSTGIAGIIMNAEFEQRCAYYEDKIKRLKDMIDNIRIAPVEQVSEACIEAEATARDFSNAVLWQKFLALNFIICKPY